jgi:hypothetical protein
MCNRYRSYTAPQIEHVSVDLRSFNRSSTAPQVAFTKVVSVNFKVRLVFVSIMLFNQAGKYSKLGI